MVMMSNSFLHGAQSTLGQTPNLLSGFNIPLTLLTGQFIHSAGLQSAGLGGNAQREALWLSGKDYSKLWGGGGRVAWLPLEGLLTSSARPADGQDEEAELLLILTSDDRHLIKSHRWGWD